MREFEVIDLYKDINFYQARIKYHIENMFPKHKHQEHNSSFSMRCIGSSSEYMTTCQKQEAMFFFGTIYQTMMLLNIGHLIAISNVERQDYAAYKRKYL